MKANLLTHTQSFEWNDLAVSREKELDDLVLALAKARLHGDRTFSPPDLINLRLHWGDLLEIVYMDNAKKLVTCPWLRHDHQTILAKIINTSMTPERSLDLTQLSKEFPSENNAWLGISPIELPKYVSDEASWHNMHSQNVAAFYSTIDKSTTYFDKFYIPKLNVNCGFLKDRIRRGREDPIFKRLDCPTFVQDDLTLHGEQIQMHFNDKKGSALNLNGDWKHGGFEIPRMIKLKLIQWGFKIKV